MINPSVTRYQRLCIWCGIGFVSLFFAALFPIAGFIPPPPPTLSGPELMDLYRDQFAMVKLAMPIGILAAGLSIPFNALIAGHIARIETRDQGMPLLSITSFGAGTVNSMLFLLPFIFWAGGYFRIDRDPALVQLISDMAWLEVVMIFSPAAIQCVCVALAGFMDKTQQAVFPRWCCFAMLWIAVLFIPGSLGIFFFHGPFAWNGLIVFWVPASVFGLQIFLLAYVMYKHTSMEKSRVGAVLTQAHAAR
ncbi:MAG: hypothetical protein ABW034_01930 [Steroidobacteraceae bacterium]